LSDPERFILKAKVSLRFHNDSFSFDTKKNELIVYGSLFEGSLFKKLKDVSHPNYRFDSSKKSISGFSKECKVFRTYNVKTAEPILKRDTDPKISNLKIQGHEVPDIE